jgi:hypothetical protein
MAKKKSAPPQRIYQFKITLVDSKPPIWRRILVPEGTLDDLHEHIQTAMGWTNSHLHQFEIGRKRYGDPKLLDDSWDDSKIGNSLETKLEELFGGNRPTKKFLYTYDFGDGWDHQVDFEGVVPAEKRRKYPSCVEGKFACPPEDVGGVWGYYAFLEAIVDPNHAEHANYVEWIGDDFNPEEFDPAEASKAMRTGLPNWRDYL